MNEAAPWLLKKLYQPEVYYQKAGVMLSELVRQGGQQTDLSAYSSASNKSNRLMEAVDQINRKYRRSTIRLALRELTVRGPCGVASRVPTTGVTGTSCPWCVDMGIARSEGDGANNKTQGPRLA